MHLEMLLKFVSPKLVKFKICYLTILFDHFFKIFLQDFVILYYDKYYNNISHSKSIGRKY
jgi:hypothetical protein